MQNHVTEFNGPSRASADMLGALQGRPVYEGTVPAKTVRKNRAANKVARASRRANRGKR